MTTTASRYERQHDQAIKQHERRWNEMRAARRLYGTDSPEYLEARQIMYDAARAMRWAARKARGG